MPIQPTYPGVYIEELPSGVRTITGVSTSVTAFVGAARRGPIEKPLRLFSFADYERAFGGLDDGSEMSYAIRQFFLNGGGEAWAVRLAKNAVAAAIELANDNGDKTLKLTALDAGSTGNGISLRVDYATDVPGSNFNLTLALTPADNPANAILETHRNLSMNSKDPRYVVTVLTNNSALVKGERLALPAGLATRKGTSTSGDLSGTADFTKLIDDTHNTIRVAVDGKPPVAVKLAPPSVSSLTKLAEAIATKLAPLGVVVTEDGKSLVFTSSTAGEFSSVRVLPGEAKDAAGALKLGTVFGGVEVDAAALLRPKLAPEAGMVKSGALAGSDLTNVPTTKKRFKIVLDGLADTVEIPGAALAGANVQAKLTDLAGRLTAAVRLFKPSKPAFAQFTASVEGTNKLVLRSGTRGAGSSVEVRAGDADDAADALLLLADADISAAFAQDTMLTGGNEEPYKPEEAFNLFIGDRSLREGIFALEAVDLFNLLVLPGVTDSGILAEAVAYCTERRAFLIADAPPTAVSPADMEKSVTGTDLPKSDHAAVYYPWIKIGDPLAGGRLRTISPGGTVAGLYARTDSARGIWKAPAGTEATLNGVQALEYALTDRENGILNPRGVNCLRIMPPFGAIAWGARTLRGDDQMADQWKYVPVRRLALYIEESLFRGTKWVVFEPNDEPLWAQIRLNLGAFMNGLFRQGAFQGATPREAYLVKCDRETTTQDDINRGVVNILVGFAPLKPAEFVFLKIQQLAGQIQT